MFTLSIFYYYTVFIQLKNQGVCGSVLFNNIIHFNGPFGTKRSLGSASFLFFLCAVKIIKKSLWIFFCLSKSSCPDNASKSGKKKKKKSRSIDSQHVNDPTPSYCGSRDAVGCACHCATAELSPVKLSGSHSAQPITPRLARFQAARWCDARLLQLAPLGGRAHLFKSAGAAAAEPPFCWACKWLVY